MIYKHVTVGPCNQTSQIQDLDGLTNQSSAVFNLLDSCLELSREQQTWVASLLNFGAFTAGPVAGCPRTVFNNLILGSDPSASSSSAHTLDSVANNQGPRLGSTFTLYLSISASAPDRLPHCL